MTRGSSATYDFTAASGTDLNTLYGWWFNENGGPLSQADVNNDVGQVFAQNDGAGSESSTHDDLNLTVINNNDTIDMNFTWKGYALLAGNFDVGKIGLSKQVASGSGSNNIMIDLVNAAGDYNISINGSRTSNGGTMTIDASYGFFLRRTAASTFDWHISKNGVIQHSGTGANLSSDTLHFFAAVSAGGVGSGLAFMQFDNVSVGARPLASPIYTQKNFTTPGVKVIQATIQNQDGNTSAILSITLTSDTTAPTIVVFDQNIMSGTKYGVTLNCVDSVSPTLDYNIFINGNSISSGSDSNNFRKYLNNQTFPNFGLNNFNAKCIDVFGNSSTRDGNSLAFMQVKIPKNASTLTNITPFSITSSDFNVNLTGLSGDQNIAGIVLSDFVSIRIDANSEFYPATYVVSTSTTTPIQPYLVPVSGNVEVAVYTINNQQGRQSIPNVLVESYTLINGVQTLVESKYSDGSGVALMHFIVGQSYTIKAYYNNVLKINLPYTPSSTNLFIFIDTGTVTNISPQGGLTIDWYHSPTQMIPGADGNISIWQLLKPFNTTIGDVNLIVSQGGSQVYTQRFMNINSAVDYNLNYDVNVAALNAFAPLTIELYVYDVNGALLSHGNASYSFVSSTLYIDTVGNIKNGLGLFVTTTLSILLTAFIISRIIATRFGEDNNFLGILALLILGACAFLGFIAMTTFFFAIMISSAAMLWKLRD